MLILFLLHNFISSFLTKNQSPQFSPKIHLIMQWSPCLVDSGSIIIIIVLYCKVRILILADLFLVSVVVQLTTNKPLPHLPKDPPLLSRDVVLFLIMSLCHHRQWRRLLCSTFGPVYFPSHWRSMIIWTPTCRGVFRVTHLLWLVRRRWLSWC